ncbi:zinc ribbon domain-containing protein [Arthrobacter zhaoxinii]|uniref:zinc ribbon domain-containing protein n=1 Tax=Arthrobacter zhaoxinii TaxID=2964616 RepID=UPI002107954B|nr:zinc ribbon domain-containing protein [Arthrobacter zhaoxinii]MCQ2001517.1 zinc ribbon domain-containing protein [Arthrobacter zhaoxinii]
MKHCTSCGAELQPHWKFCTNCQAPQPAATGSETTATPAAEAGSPQPDEFQTQQFEQPPAQQAQPTQQFEQPPAQQAQQAQQAQPTPTGIPTAPTSVFDPPVAAPAASLAHSGSVQSSPLAAGPTDGGSNDGGPSGPQGPAGSGTPSSGGKKRSRRTIILVSVLALLVVLGLGAFLFVQNMIRGGAGSAESAADKMVEAIESKDFIGLATMVPPEEREPLQRLQEHLMDKAEDFRLEDAINKVADEEAELDDDLTFDGISITFDGVEPEITEIDDSTALIKYTSGEARFQLDPAETTGAIRSALEASGHEDEEKIDETVQLNELGPDGSPLTLVATERGGRWYVSPMYSITEMVSESEGYDHGSIPESAGGSDSPAAAAQAAVEAVPDVMSEGSVNPLAGTLSIHEGSLLFLYQDLFDDALAGAGGEELNIGDVRFTEGEKDGDRAVAVVENITVESEYGDKLTLTGDCIEGERESDSICFGDSGYSIEPSMQMLGGAKIMSLTTIKEDGEWRVSLGHTVTDWIINWTDSLTREQALAMLQLANAEDATGDISVEEATEVEFNSAGFAVLNLTVEEETALTSEDDYEFSDMAVYSADGKELVGDLGYGDEIPAGDYKLVVFAGSEWQEGFAEKGNDFEYSAELTLVEDEPYDFDSSDYPSDESEYPSDESDYSTESLPSGSYLTTDFGVLTTESAEDSVKSHTISGTDVAADLEISAFGSSSSSTVLGITLDGKEQKLEIPKGGTDATELVIAYPNDGKDHELKVQILSTSSESESVLVSYTAALKTK